MKKTYMTPSVEVVRIKAQTMIAASTDGFKGALGTTEVGGDVALGRERGSRTESDDFDGLW